MAPSSSTDTLLPMNTLMHLLTIRLSPSNYLLWKSQLIPLLTHQGLLGHVDGTSSAPPTELLNDNKPSPNPAYAAWIAADQRTVIILQASLMEEAFSEIIGLDTARQIWVALETAYSNSSVERIQNLRDQLRQFSKGASSVADYGRKFKSICDQLSAIGHPVAEYDKIHWFLCGLGGSFETFSTAVRASRTPLLFWDLLTQAEGHEMFLKSIHGTVAPPVVFTSQTLDTTFNRGRGGRFSRGGRGRGRRSPHCQLCRTNGHYANVCPRLATYSTHAPTSDDALAKAFHAQCHVSSTGPDWYVDSGATDHMISSSSSVTQAAPYSGPNQVSFGNGQVLPISLIGQSSVNNTIRLRDVLVIPKITKNLLSVSKLTFDNNLDDRTTRKVLAQGRCERGLYVLSTSPRALFASTKSKLKASFELWHSRLGHVSLDTIVLLNKQGRLSVTSLLPNPVVCSPCQKAKAHRLPFVLNEKCSLNILDLVHCDLWRPSPECSVDGYRYYVAFFVQTQFSRKVKVFQTNGGTEFLNHHVRNLLDDNGTFHRVSCPYTPQQNARVERKHRHIVETGLAMLFHAHVPPAYWVHAFSSAIYLINRLLTSVLKNKSPFELVYNRAPTYDHLRPFGCRVYPYLSDYAEHKLSPRSLPCIFLRYCSRYKGYQCLDPMTSRIYITDMPSLMNNFVAGSVRSVGFVTGSVRSGSSSPLPTCGLCDDSSCSPAEPTGVSLDTIDRTVPPVTSDQPEHSTLEPSVASSVPAIPMPASPAIPLTPATPAGASDSIPLSSGHPMITRAKAGVFKPKHRADLAHTSAHGLYLALFASTDPKGYKSAAKHPHWITAMHREMEALHRNNTWTLVSRPEHHNVVGSRWLFRTKYRADGSIERHKARLVAQGFSQLPGLDYSNTFSPVVKASTVRIVLSLAVLNNWKLRQLDVNNAFLNGEVSELVYMEQPPGFQDAAFPHHAPRAWFHRLSTFLIGSGFVCSKADPSLFYLLVYVDDLILTGNHDEVIQYFITKLHDAFAVKDLGRLNFFLGLEAIYTDTGLFLSQSKYAHDILQWANLLNAKPATTPLASNAAFVTSGDIYDNPTHYRSLVGAIQYLTITRPDISYAVNQVSQFLQAPTHSHYQSVKRILCYVKGTLSFGLTFSRHQSTALLGYSDADWARCLETRRSTYGYSIFLGGNLVSWSAKKQPTLHALPPDRPTLLCDNKSALFLTQNPVSHKRTKHIELDYHFIRELVSSGKLHTRFVPTKLQVADIFTKSLPRHQFEFFRDMLCIRPPPFRLRGDISHP
ncbi:hypothetical protein OSB04_028650 [Centaurea solstitialis]|uniref:Integrase catalytic domain-containing protein n=1 Tax=Centaurea solstitialis TaxID=347529 RepID=A0AA38SG09_9ASTR|nr:hypothetical protein OSB04_028650 [Centaurea solstitialis]